MILRGQREQKQYEEGIGTRRRVGENKIDNKNKTGQEEGKMEQDKGGIQGEI